MLETFRGTRTLRYLWYEQRGLCTQCNTKITRITGWRLHYCVPRVMGGSTGATNRVLLHPEYHDRVHRQRLSVSLGTGCRLSSTWTGPLVSRAPPAHYVG